MTGADLTTRQPEPPDVAGSALAQPLRTALARWDAAEEPLRTDPGVFVYWGCICLALLIGVFGAWAATVPLASAVIAPGVVKVLSQRRAVQHLEGGIVKAILVREGERVERGQLLARLDTTQSEAALGVLETNLFATLASEARLQAEQAGATAISFPEELEVQSARPEAQTAMESQLAEFTARAAALQGQRNRVDQQVQQLADTVRGTESSNAGLTRQLAFLREEIKDSEFLLKKGLARKPKILALKRAEAEAEAQFATNEASIAQARGKLAELEEQRRQLLYDRLQEIAKQRHGSREQIADLRHRIAAARDTLLRSEIRAPESGVVVGLDTRSLNAVLPPRETLLGIVPVQDRLVVEGEVKPIDRSEVRIGQHARVRVLAFNSRRTPMLAGSVTMVTPDALVEARTGRSFYKAEVDLRQAPELSHFFVSLQPGMPVEIFIETGERTFAEYLLQPLAIRLHRAFRES
ncbi:hemolysin secretion protein D [Bosea sp. Root381]|uniref:HlyD family type I secretion periplasmic adaptor subunit n=1 Tax=Bosea sp. Root381 TaxID=1736524 RepID=UPI0006F6A23F|nr:HlyD family type I secretion periplasmic adaptor subunit [Bosea sp. Root381]KRD96321.1 hemolysin secretion protein D [Bosea sp. Root381]